MEAYLELGFYIVLGLFALSTTIAVVLGRMWRKSVRNCEWAGGLITRLANENNWGEITVLSSRNNEPQVYKTWIGDGDPQDLARRATL